MKRIFVLANRANGTPARAHSPIPQIPTPREKFAALTNKMSNNKNNQRSRIMEPQEHPIPLLLLAFEHGTNADQLAAQLSTDVEVDDCGIRCVTRAVARRWHTERLADDAAQRERQQRSHAEMSQQTNALRRRITAIDARDRRLRESGEIADGVSAFAMMATADHQNKMESTGRTFDELKDATNRGDYGVYHPIRQGEQS
ncbi:hypothetical protein M2432_005213 [Mycobacterium sp. OTB74]|nr:hypothetical protein [Mycobacterium sp. OTB74]